MLDGRLDKKSKFLIVQTFNLSLVYPRILYKSYVNIINIKKISKFPEAHYVAWTVSVLTLKHD